MITVTSKARAIFFIADAHLGQRPSRDLATTRALLSFFAHVKEQRGALVVLGDLFDFWFEYGSVVPRKYFQVLAAMKGLSDAGCEVLYVGGNHDYWIGPFMEREIGIRISRVPVELLAQGHRIYLAHGDGLSPRDWPYRTFRGILRSRPVSAAWRLIHPGLGLAIARSFSLVSRNRNSGHPPDIERLWREIAAPRFELGFDTVILGHIHTPTAVVRQGRALFSCGNWISDYSYVLLEEGALGQRRWRA